MDFDPRELASAFNQGFSESYSNAGKPGSGGSDNPIPGIKPVIASVSNKLKKKKQSWTPYQTDRSIDMSANDYDDGQ